MIELKQALRNAIEVERSATRFYDRLAAKTAPGPTRDFLEQMVREETTHAAAFEAKAQELAGGLLPVAPDRRVDTVETIPEWSLAESIGLEEALQIAVEAEQHAELYYDAVADSLGQGPVAEFYRSVADTESRHAQALIALVEELRSR
jgi:rubrerythrin